MTPKPLLAVMLYNMLTPYTLLYWMTPKTVLAVILDGTYILISLYAGWYLKPY